ncbi:hypothetical protein L208DRAFT_1401188 [Tricholoma matsutake]|nr:hypothetical protein L208DRAFT_1401188 [Tricholoma matsutake 945]
MAAFAWMEAVEEGRNGGYAPCTITPSPFHPFGILVKPAIAAIKAPIERDQPHQGPHAATNGTVSFNTSSFVPRDVLPAWEQSFFVEEKGWVRTQGSHHDKVPNQHDWGGCAEGNKRRICYQARYCPTRKAIHSLIHVRPPQAVVRSPWETGRHDTWLGPRHKRKHTGIMGKESERQNNSLTKGKQRTISPDLVIRESDQKKPRIFIYI